MTMMGRNLYRYFVLMLFISCCPIDLAVSTSNNHILKAVANSLSDVDIECNSNNILIQVSTSSTDFHGMIYPRGLSKNSSCLAEYEHAGSKVIYKLPLRSCNTMSHDVSSNSVEYYNTIVIEPHSKLVTSQGRGFHVRCRYNSKSTSNESGVNAIGTTPMANTPPLPNCYMKIYVGRPDEHIIAEHVKIGDYLSLVISMDEQDTYGLKVTNCIVRDGLSSSEHPLINNFGCPIDESILGQFEYSRNLTSAVVTFPAHRFPVTSSVYYACNVKLCLKKSGGCDDTPPICDETGQNVRRRRRKRQSELTDNGSLTAIREQDEDVRDRSVEVFSGLYVNEVDDELEDGDTLPLSTRSDEEFCVSTRKFAIGIAIAGILLMLAVILLVACIVQRRRRRKGSSTTGSSIYSGPYSNHAYSRD